MSGLPTPPIKGISVLFLKVADVLPPDSQYVNGLEIIYAIEKVSGRGTIEGAQRMGNLFRIYVKNDTARNKLIIEGFTFQGHQVTLYKYNPFSVKDQSPETVKIIIGGVPISVAHDEFEKALLDLKVEMVSEIKFENYRDPEGKWTNYKTGRRFVYCKKPTLNLKPFTKVGLWNATIYYKGQLRPSKQPKINNMHQVTSTEGNESTTTMSQVPPYEPDTNNDDTDKVGTSNVEVASVRCDQNDSIEVTESQSQGLGMVKKSKSKVKSSAASPSASPNSQNAAHQNRGRATTRKIVHDPKQTKIAKMLARKISTSNPRNKRSIDTSPQSPLPPKSNTRSKSSPTDWFEETGDSELC